MENKFEIVYKFSLPSGEIIKYKVPLLKDSLLIADEAPGKKMEWAKLEFFKCPNCPLDSSLIEYCPLALHLIQLIRTFSHKESYTECEVEVETPARSYKKKTTLQAGVSSLLGIIMVASGCPVMRKLKPILHFHLPFASLEETEIRAFSLYLMSQYINWKKGKHPDWEMNNLFNFYEEIKILNINVSRKIADLEKKDTSINSITVLNNFAEYVTFSLDEKDLSDIEIFFDEFMR